MTRSAEHLANDAWESLLTAHSVVMRELIADDIWDELTIREYDVLYTLSKCDHPQRLSDLNRHVLLSQPALSRLVERLIARGLIDRRRDPDDGRSVLLTLTEAGRAAQRRTGRRHASTVARLVKTRLNPDEQSDLERLCTSLATAPTQRSEST
ncbi:MarR family transcriptional regulator [Propionimicrobium sp. PCR01-08-3]|uniref:MarR family winged helix-turn-helix transcriptional regulator n=1 Tax=Propionimicrobium sp. PCR01-08-3 TaxID=3052086 RepID=UPI00255CE779|nr:MarR family transcriptional regulator [Propionimicrobium sp. PCR01-08-3]WIY83119.1 MarR family transcriptional regulator [Propionimicrobium sp. PCR01-08-3]